MPFHFYIAYAATIYVGYLIFKNLLSHVKGDKVHVLRWFWILVISLGVITMNTILTPSTAELYANRAFQRHISFGSVFLIGHLLMGVTGGLRAFKEEFLQRHALLATITLYAKKVHMPIGWISAVSFVISNTAAVLIRGIHLTQ